MMLDPAQPALPARTYRFLRIGLGAGAVTTLAGIIAAPERAWSGLLIGSFLLVSLALSGIFFVASQYASGATWSIAFRRVPEAMSAALPWGAAGVAAVLLFGSSLYAWRQGGGHPSGFQHIWLNFPFLLARAAVYIGLWIVLARMLVQNSRSDDAGLRLRSRARNVRLSLLFLIIFAVTFWLASFDWVMSLEPHWYSTIFGIYNFAGMFSSGLAAMILLILWMKRAGPLRGFITAEHLHDLGKLLFAFSTFWMYIWFSQYMLIWYANIPEETVYFIRRQQGYWQPLFLLNLFLNWVVPFIVLLPRWTKRSPEMLGKVAAAVLVGRILDAYLMIGPANASGPALGVWEAGPLLMAGSIFVWVFVRAMRQATPVPWGDERLSESLHYHN
jgi:hypothetical protein